MRLGAVVAGRGGWVVAVVGAVVVVDVVEAGVVASGACATGAVSSAPRAITAPPPPARSAVAAATPTSRRLRRSRAWVSLCRAIYVPLTVVPCTGRSVTLRQMQENYDIVRGRVLQPGLPGAGDQHEAAGRAVRRATARGWFGEVVLLGRGTCRQAAKGRRSWLLRQSAHPSTSRPMSRWSASRSRHLTCRNTSLGSLPRFAPTHREVPRVQQGAGRQPWRDRRPRVPRRVPSSAPRRSPSSRYEDRKSEHRLKADEAYQIGEQGHPVRAYLDPAAIVRDRRRGRRRRGLPRLRLPVGEPRPGRGVRRARASPSSARPPSVLHLTGNKARAIAAAREAGLPVLRSVRAEHRRRRRSLAAAEEIGFPIFVKAVAGGGGRGMRRVERPEELREALEAGHARGRVRLRRPDRLPRAGRGRARGTSRCRSSPTAPGNVIHLFERDCSVQRRHQKVVEIAPGPEPRPRSCASGSAPTPSPSPAQIGYVNAGTVEFLLDARTAATSSSR